MSREHALLVPLAAIAETASLKDAPSLVTKAQERLGRGEYREAIVLLRAATQLNPQDYAAQKLLAGAAFQDNDMVLAANACEAAVRLNPNDADVRLGLARALFVLNRLPDAATVCRAVLALPSSAQEQRQAARKILERIPAREQKLPPETTFPIISAYSVSSPRESRSGIASR